MPESRRENSTAARADLAFTAFLLAVCACLCTEVVLYSQNTLFLKTDWVVTKRMVVMGLNGSDQFLLSRSTLAKNTLHLGAWYGLAEVLLRQPSEPRAVQFSFKVDDAGSFSFLWGQTQQGFSGLRLSRHPALSSAAFQADEDGGIRSEAEIPIAPISPGWHRLSLRFESGGLSGQVDGLESFHVAEPSTSLGRIGFRNGSKGSVDIDDVIIESNGGVVFRDSFQNRVRWLNLTALNFAALSAVAALLAVAWRLGSGHVDWHQFSLRISMMAFTCSVCVGAFFVYDFAYLSKLPLDIRGRAMPAETPATFPPPPETVRFHVFNVWYWLAGGETITVQKIAALGYPMDRIFKGPVFCGPEGVASCRRVADSDLAQLVARQPHGYRMMFVGSSQTIGIGADSLDRTFFVRIHGRLVEALGAARPLVSINVAVAAGQVRQLLELFQRRYLELKPDLVVINFSNNDNAANLRTGISDFLDLNRAHGISTVLLEEANTIEFPGPPPVPIPFLDAQHRILRELASNNDVPIWGIHAFLGTPEVFRSGFVWWDDVHLTSHGQRLLAEWLQAKLLTVIGAPGVTKPSPIGGHRPGAP